MPEEMPGLPEIPVVYPVTNATVPNGDAGGTIPIRLFSHWWADDPIVKANPGLFSADSRWGMQYSVEPPGYAPEGTGMAPTLDGHQPAFTGARGDALAAPVRGGRSAAGLRRSANA